MFPSAPFRSASRSDEPALPAAQYHIYAGNTHSHTSFTWSHGAQWAATPPAKMFVKDSTSFPDPGNVLKPDWQKEQGPPSVHFALAKANHYDFYITTDHSQEKGFQPVSPTNPQWLATKLAAREATDAHFLGLAGYEHSENNGPGGVGHLNVINSAEYLNALSPGVDLPALYRWLKTVPSDGDGPVVVSFNHPGAKQYNNWADRDPEVTDIITMLEVINSDKNIHYAGFLAATPGPRRGKCRLCAAMTTTGLGTASPSTNPERFVLATSPDNKGCHAGRHETSPHLCLPR